MLGVLACAVAGGCGGPATGGAAPSGPASVAASTPPLSVSAGPPSPSGSPSLAPGFVGTSAPVAAADVPHSWRSGCPIGPEQLSLLHLSYWGFDNRAHVGTMVVNKAVVDDVVKVFGTLYRERFPIRQMQPVDAYGGSDPDSMAADNTSGFNCRNAVAPGPAHWSVHAYGEAIDVNTVENPYLEGGKVLPPAGAAYLDRSKYRPGMAVPGGLLVKAFAAVGWKWGGRWTSAPDYQHFSKTGG
ncbi:MAG: hypothetical protein AUI14_26395 [Actinobacteria bacterium 13_2_20CM_2_71_6]|nr:MAG: hypothetical protein AUI14_26395 [Actinobacteria bacterium 13_2_20CM_2_71_6]